MTFVIRALWSLPLMAVVAVCLFGFVDTWQPMPRVQQFAWRGVYGLAGAGTLGAIVWLWLKPRRPGATA